MKNFSRFIPAICSLLFIAQSVTAQSLDINILWQKTVQVQTIKFSPDNIRLVTGGSADNCFPYLCGQIKVWQVTDGDLLTSIENPAMGLTNDVDVSSDGQTIISGNGSVYCAPDGGCSADKPGQFKYAVDGRQLKSLTNPGGNVYAIEYSPDQTVIAAGGL
ncbi:MAG: hypothetical protein H0W62_04515 [Chitinophagales bacterium]|nr:hypothetical protein [Chitinophagales bacterium]